MEEKINLHSSLFPDLHVAYCTDQGYFLHSVAAILSLLESNCHRLIHVHLVVQGVSDEDLAKLRFVLGTYDALLYIYPASAEDSADFVVRSSTRLSTAAYLRCLLAEKLPLEVDKVLYLDGDTIVKAPIDELYDHDLTNKAAAVVKDYGQVTAVDLERLHLPADAPYFNSGVMLLNLHYWREHRVLDQCRSYFREYTDRVFYDDQDVLNAVLWQQVIYLSPKWNVQDMFFRADSSAVQGFSPKELEELRIHPAIVHFTRVPKPWQAKCLHPYAKDYAKMLRVSKWKKLSPTSHVGFKLKRKLRKLLVDLRLVKRRFISL